MKNKVYTILFFVCCLAISNSIGKHFINPGASEFRHGINQYLSGNGMLVKSLNEELDTVYIFGLHNTTITGKEKTYTARFMGPIILYSVYGGITGDRQKLNIILSLLMLGLGTNIYLILRKEKIFLDNKKNITLILAGGLPIYVYYGGIISDLPIPYFLFFLGHYLKVYRKNTILGHFFMLISGFYRYEFVGLYVVHGIIFGKRKVYHYLIGLIAIISIIISLNFFYKGEFGVSRDKFGEVKKENEIVLEKKIFNSEQERLEATFDDYVKQSFQEGYETIDKKSSNIIETTLRYMRFNKLGINTRLYHIWYTIVGLGFISNSIIFGWLFILKKGGGKRLILFILVLMIYVLNIYGASKAYYGYKQDIIQSSYIRYLLGVLFLIGSLGFIYVIRNKRKILAILIFTASLISPLKFISNGLPFYLKISNYKTDAINYEKYLKEKPDNIIWIAKGVEKQAIFEHNQNVYSYEQVDQKILEEEILKLINNGKNKGFKIVFGISSKRLDENMKEILNKYFSTPTQINSSIFYEAK